MTPVHIRNEQDFLKLYDTYSNDIFRHALLWTNDRERALSVMCETFKRLWLFVSSGNSVDEPRLYLYREAGALLREAPVLPLVEALPVSATDASYTFLHQLEPDARQVYLLHYVDGLTFLDITAVVGGSPQLHEETVMHIDASFRSTSAHAIA